MEMWRAILHFFILVTSTATADRSSQHTPQLYRDRRMLPTVEAKYWPKAIVPYVIKNDEVPKQQEDLKIMAEYEANSCVRFIPWNETVGELYGLGHDGNLNFFKGDGCFAAVGFRDTRDQKISCCSNMLCVHEIGHALGFGHEIKSPLRVGWMRVDKNAVWSRQNDFWKILGITGSDYKGSVNYPYDISSAMHGEGGIHLKFPELNMEDIFFYQFKELSLTYNCQQYAPCNKKQLGCVNEGYTSIHYGKCECICPLGLDPVTLCAEPIRSVTMSWPKGQYSLPMNKAGCPSKEFQKGSITLQGLTNDKGGTNIQFCTRTIQDGLFNSVEEEKWNWPLGNYCIYKGGNKCPFGFDEGSVNLGNVGVNATTGKLPTGQFDKSVTIEFCCQFRGISWYPRLLPIDKPFSVIQLEKAEQCQAIVGARSQEEEVTYQGSGFISTGKVPYLTQKASEYSITLCHYTPTDMNCGDVIMLDKNNTETTIQFSGKGRTDLECTWVVRGDVEEGHLVLDFEDMDVKINGNTCVDKVHVKHALIGQLGGDYCGQSIDHSIRSVTNKMMIRFLTDGKSDSSFKANVKWIPNEDMCYDVRDRGVSYDGKVNYTRTFEPCLPWAQANRCYHNPFRVADIVDNLEENYCRNPDNSFGPWCYTDTKDCLRNYCDVCGLEKPYDQIQGCVSLKKEGFCERDGGVGLKYCAATCNENLSPSSQKYTDVSCGPPQPPNDGKMIGKFKSIYRLGEIVEYQCSNGASIMPSTCMTSGQWSEVPDACLECPLGLFAFNDSCSVLYYKKGGYTRQEAIDICSKNGGVLAAPKSQLENDFTMIAIKETIDAWIGINDVKKEGTWVYDQNERNELDWTNWLTNQPNNYGGQDCGVMNADGSWEDYSCTEYKSQAVCKIQKATKPSKCFDFLGDSRCQSFLKGNPNMCSDFQGHVRIYCRKTCGLCPESKGSCSTENSNDNVNKLSSDTSISVGQSVTYSCAKYTYKIGGDEIRACLSDGILTGQPLQCGECPLDYVSSQYACHGSLRKNLTFEQAKTECGHVGGYVAMPKSPGENDIISSVTLGANVWLGAVYNRKTFRWGDESLVSWNQWAGGKPKTSNGNCVILSMNKKWVNVKCKVQYTTVCTIPKLDNYACYDVADKGLLYDGKVNTTIDNEPCRQWTNVTDERYHPWKQGNEFKRLEHNYCRLTAHSTGPWCYRKGFWGNCYPCQGEKPKPDTAKDCGKQRDNGVCTKNVTKATEECEQTCSDLLPNKGRTFYKDVKCQKPNPPTGAIIDGIIKSNYSVGDVVSLKCNSSGFVVNTTCLTSGDWSQAGQVCSECPMGYTLVNEKCYGRHDKYLTYLQAEKTCAEMGGSLPSPKSMTENNHLKNIYSSGYVWLAAKKPHYASKQFVWQDESTVEWTNWAKYFPSVDQCVIINKFGKWETTDCEFTSPAIGLSCVTPKQTTSVVCADFLDRQCKEMLINRPNVCKEEADFDHKYCQKSCGFC